MMMSTLILQMKEVRSGEVCLGSPSASHFLVTHFSISAWKFQLAFFHDTSFYTPKQQLSATSP